MIKQFTITNHLNEALTVELTDPEKTGFIIREITGIGPIKADIHTTDLASTDGSLYNSARATERNIVVKLRFMDGTKNGSIEDVRQKTYKYFPVKKPITLRFETDNRDCYIDGYVETNEPDIFSKEEGCDISIICPFPYFYSIKNNLTVFNGVEAEFEFPFSNESLTEPLLNMGNIVNYQQRSVYYEGDAPTGITIAMHAIGPITGFTLYNVTTRERISISDEKYKAVTGEYILNGDDIIINTVKGQKSARLLRGGVYTNILNAMDKDLDWFQIDKGDNIFAYTVKSGIENVMLSIEHKVLFEGI